MSGRARRELGAGGPRVLRELFLIGGGGDLVVLAGDPADPYVQETLPVDVCEEVLGTDLVAMVVDRREWYEAIGRDSADVNARDEADPTAEAAEYGKVAKRPPRGTVWLVLYAQTGDTVRPIPTEDE